MKVFIVEGDPKYQSLTLVNGDDHARCPKPGGPPPTAEALRSILFCRLVPFRRQGDFRASGPSMTCGPAVFEKVRDTLQGEVEAFEIKVDDEGGQTSLLLHPTIRLDAVDVDAVKRHWATGSTEMFYAFKPAAFTGPQMFTAEWFSPTVFYVTGLRYEERDFYVRCQQLKLTGIRFIQVWEA